MGINGESGPELDKLLLLIAKGMAERHFIRMGYDSPQQASAVCGRRVRREFGMAAIMGQAWLIHDRAAVLEFGKRTSYFYAAEAPDTNERFHGQPDRHDPQPWQ